MRPHLAAPALTWSLLASLLCAPGRADAAPAPAPREGAQQIADVGDLALASGQVLRGCRVGYRTFGRLNAARSNAVLFPTWFGGTTADLVDLIGPGKVADSSRYFVIAVDALANGVSSSPSNSPTQRRMRFPNVGVRDMVESQRLLVTRVLGLPRLHAVLGISMGGMQALQWAVSHPELLERAVALVASPRLTAYDLLLWQAELDAIFSDPEWKGGDYTRPPLMAAVHEIHDLALSTPERFNREHGRAEMLVRPPRRQPSGIEAADRVRQLQAMMAHDVSAPFGGSLAKVGAALAVPLLLVVDARDHMVTPGPALELAASAPSARVLELDTGCGHLAPGCASDKINAAVARFLEGAARASTGDSGAPAAPAKR